MDFKARSIMTNNDPWRKNFEFYECRMTWKKKKYYSSSVNLESPSSFIHRKHPKAKLTSLFL